MFGIVKIMIQGLLAVGLAATLQEPASVKVQFPPPLEPSDTSSPRATLDSFVESCNELFDVLQQVKATEKASSQFLPATERIFDCLDLSQLPNELRDTIGVETAVFLKEVIDRIELPPDVEIPDADSIQNAEKNGIAYQWRIPHTRIAIARMESGPRRGKFLFTPESVRNATKFYSAVKRLPYRKDGRRTSAGFRELYVAATKRQPTLSADTSSPRGTLTLFQNSVDAVFEEIKKSKVLDRTNPEFAPLYSNIYNCLNLSELPEYSREYYVGEAAVCIKEVLDRVVLPPIEEIPGAENVSKKEGKEAIVSWQIPGTQLTIAKVVEGPRRGEFLFTPESVKRATEYYDKVKLLPYRTDGKKVSEGLHRWWLSTPGNPTVAAWVGVFPESVRIRFMRLAYWQWGGLLATITIAFGLMILAYRIGMFLNRRWRHQYLLGYWLTLIFPVAAMSVPLVFKDVIYDFLSIRSSVLYVAHFSADLVFLMALIAVIVGVSTRIAETIVALPSIRPQGLDAHLVRIIFRVFGIVSAVVVFLEGGKYLGFPVTTLVASAGIGGLAIALSAQGLVKGLFGTVAILLDKPFAVGERIIVDQEDGIVEEIGLRSTKIRSFLTNHLVSIPNDVIAERKIQNIGRRNHIRRVTNLHIPLDTPREKVEKAVGIIRQALDDHEGMTPDLPPRVYFNEFNDDSFNIRISYWFQPPVLWQFLEFSEKLNFEIFRAFEENQIQFSLPLRHSYWKHDDDQGSIDINLTTGDSESDVRSHPS